MTGKQNNIVTIILIIFGAVIPYLLSQQDVPLLPIAKVGLTAVNLGLLAYARLSGTQAVPVAAIASPISTPQGETATVTPTKPTPGP